MRPGTLKSKSPRSARCASASARRCACRASVVGRALTLGGKQRHVSQEDRDLGADAQSWAYDGNGSVFHNGKQSSYGSGQLRVGDVLGVLVDFDRGELVRAERTQCGASSNLGCAQSFVRNRDAAPTVAFANFLADALSPVVYIERRAAVAFDFAVAVHAARSSRRVSSPHRVCARSLPARHQAPAFKTGFFSPLVLAPKPQQVRAAPRCARRRSLRQRSASRTTRSLLATLRRRCPCARRRAPRAAGTLLRVSFSRNRLCSKSSARAFQFDRRRDQRRRPGGAGQRSRRRRCVSLCAASGVRRPARGGADYTSDTTLLVLAWRAAARRCWQVGRWRSSHRVACLTASSAVLERRVPLAPHRVLVVRRRGALRGRRSLLACRLFVAPLVVQRPRLLLVSNCSAGRASSRCRPSFASFSTLSLTI